MATPNTTATTVPVTLPAGKYLQPIRGNSKFDTTKYPRISKNIVSTPFYLPTERFGGYSDEPGVRPSSVRPSVRKHFRVRSIS